MSPLTPEARARYGADWGEFSRMIRFDRAGGRCECSGQCGIPHSADRCAAMHGWPHPVTASRVILTVAHLCHTPECREHVLAMCQRCHLRLDAAHHAQSRERRRHAELAESGQGQLLTPDE